jgi:hypothetical protein
MPSTDPAADADYFTDVLGARPVFRIEAFGARVAMVELASGRPQLLLADHLKGERPVLVYRVGDLGATLDELESRGWRRSATFGIPHGPCCSLEIPGGHRIAVYELTRPQASERLGGRRDF